MFKYKNNCNYKLMIEVNNKVITIKPNEVIDSTTMLFNKYLTEITPKVEIKPQDKIEVKKSNKQQKLEGFLNDS